MFYAAHTPSSLSRLVRSSVLFSSPRSLFRAPRLNHPSFHRPPRFPAKPYRQYTPSAPLSLSLSLSLPRVVAPLPPTYHHLPPTAFPVILSEHRRTRPRIIINPRPRHTPCLCRSSRRRFPSRVPAYSSAVFKLPSANAIGHPR